MRMKGSMAMAPVFAALLLLLSCSLSAAVAQQYEVPAILYGGFEVIFCNDTSFLDEIDNHGSILYVAGSGLVREVRESPFELSYAPTFFAQSHRFIDFKVFSDAANNSWSFGPTTAHHVAGDVGFNHPFHIASMDDNDTAVIPSLIMSTVIAHKFNDSARTQIAYLAGWSSARNAAGDDSLSFTVTRVVLDTDAVKKRDGSFLSVSSTLTLGNTGYADYTRTFKPRIFRSHKYPYLVVLDPASRAVYKVSAPDDLSAQLKLSGSPYSLAAHTHVSGSAFDSHNSTLYIGVPSLGTLPGKIIAFNTDSMKEVATYTLALGESNPRAMAVRHNHLYVGINGGHSILVIDTVSGKTIQYATLPWYLRNVESISANRDGYVYFTTYEQRAKVARVSTDNFCSSVCDHNFGYCENTMCKCLRGYSINTTTLRCHANTTDHTKPAPTASHAGEIALGLLFGVTLVAAAVGWFLLWRHRQEHLGGSSGYSRPHEHGEHESFLDEDDA